MDGNGLENSILEFLKVMPKVELHAHLNGSLSENTLKKLILKKKQKCDYKDSNLSIPNMSSNELSRCFETFDLIHNITDSPEAIYMATCDVVEEFYRDGVFYLELRTTPKECPSMSQEMYVECVLKAINDVCSQTDDQLIVKLILSVDRKRPITDAQKTLRIAEEFSTSFKGVIGLDFSGDPTVGNISSFIPILELAKKKGLKLAVHIAEVPDKFDEVKALLNLQPDRLGHGTFILPCKNGSTSNFGIFEKFKIPLEVCLTSNVMSKTVASYEDHHFKFLREMGYPCILCTDDKGVFNTTLSKEYYLAHKYYFLSKEDLVKLSYSSIDHIFSPETVKGCLRELWNQKINLL